MEEMASLWDYRSPDWGTRDFVGYKVEALDGEIGKVDEASNELDFRCLVIDTGPWILGKKVLLPAGLVERVDDSRHRIVVDGTKDVLKHAPEYHDDLFYDEDFRESVDRYFGAPLTNASARLSSG